MTIIYHNPSCGTSRNTLALLQAAGSDVKIIEYLHSPPSREELISLLARAGLTLRDVLRKKGTPYGELGLANPDLGDAALLDAIEAHPILINRPIVVTERGVALCRPSDVVLDLLPPDFRSSLVKEEGAPFLRDPLIMADDPGFTAALAAESLAVDDLSDDNRTFFAYRDLEGALLGFGGYELYGSDVFLRSIVVTQEARGKRIGRNLVPLLLYRAWRKGARTAWLLTSTASGFFEKIGFKPRSRAEAPPAILETRQAQSLCPASATLLSKSMGF